MNFLLRATSSSNTELPSIRESSKETEAAQLTLDGLIAEDPIPESPASEDSERENHDGGSFPGVERGLNAKCQISAGSHSDVMEDEGWILVPYMELHDDWITSPDIESLRSLDRSFLFPGEKIHVLACLAASKQDAEVITPFKVAAVISKNGILSQNTNQDSEGIESISIMTEANSFGHTTPKEVENSELKGITKSISMTESLIRMEDQKQKVEELLHRLKNSHFFVRISESNEPLWSKRNVVEKRGGDILKTSSLDTVSNAIIDQAKFDGSSGGIARNSAKCCSLLNGDIVVLLEVSVGTDNLRDPVLEILQFEKFNANSTSAEDNQNGMDHGDPSGELLSWLLPLDRALPPSRPLSPVNSGASVSPHRPTLSASSGSQLFSFGNFRSYSMPSMPQSSVPSSDTASSVTKSSFNSEDFNLPFIKDRQIKNGKVKNEGLLSFRGVPLEPGRYTVQCGLGGIYLPGKRWRRKLEIIQPIDIQSFTSGCNTEDFLCVQIKNVSPSHIPDLVVYVDSISIVFEEAPKDGRPLSLPISCIEAGSDHGLPNLALRRGEQHSFILKMATSNIKDLKVPDKLSQISQLQVKTSGADAPNANQFAVLVSCRCNYTESKLFFKQPTSWKPRISKGLLISVASEISEQTFGSHMKISQLPVQTLTLQASNLTTEDATLTVLAPASSTAPPSVVSLSSDPTSPSSPFAVFPEIMARTSEIKGHFGMQRLSSTPAQEIRKESGNGGGAWSISLNDRTAPVSDMIPNPEFGCTHLWLQSTVPLGYVPAQSSTTVKLELLPLTDGIITLDSLQINVKEKGVTYIPEQPLKIHATSSVAT